MKEELKRRKIFLKKAIEITKLWPGYAAPLPTPTCETDRYLIGLLEASRDNLVAVWKAARTGDATLDQFEKVVELWWVERLRAHSGLCIK